MMWRVSYVVKQSEVAYPYPIDILMEKDVETDTVPVLPAEHSTVNLCGEYFLVKQ